MRHQPRRCPCLPCVYERTLLSIRRPYERQVGIAWRRGVLYALSAVLSGIVLVWIGSLIL